ncbi:MAG: hypothetical protein WDZ31_10775 [Phycisphaeraceae bacterium]
MTPFESSSGEAMAILLRVSAFVFASGYFTFAAIYSWYIYFGHYPWEPMPVTPQMVCGNSFTQPVIGLLNMFTPVTALLVAALAGYGWRFGGWRWWDGLLIAFLALPTVPLLGFLIYWSHAFDLNLLQPVWWIWT